jgi:PadR family transcriptional regulator PadR
MRNESIHGHLEDLILAVLSRHPAHGYGILQRLRETSGGVLDVPEGSLYPALYRLERAGLVESAWSRESARPRRVYRITPAGRAALERGRSEWRRFAAAVEAVLAPTAVEAEGRV